MRTKPAADPRIDPRIKAAMGAFPTQARDDATEIFQMACSDVSRETAASPTEFCRET